MARVGRPECLRCGKPESLEFSDEFDHGYEHYCEKCDDDYREMKRKHRQEDDEFDAWHNELKKKYPEDWYNR